MITNSPFTLDILTSETGVSKGISEQANAAEAAKQAKDAELAKEQAKMREAKEVLAQVKQLIDVNKQPRDKGDIVVNFTDANVVKRLYVNQATHQLITQARLAIAKLHDGYELIPLPVADKIAMRHPEAILYLADDAHVLVLDPVVVILPCYIVQTFEFASFVLERVNRTVV